MVNDKTLLLDDPKLRLCSAKVKHSICRRPPADFIAVAEETGSIVDLGAWVLRTACQQLATWRRDYAGRSRLSVSVNVSANQLLTPGFPLVVARTLEDIGLEASAIHLEIT